MLLLVPPSLTLKVIVAVPEALAAGLNESEPVEFGVTYETVGLGTSTVLLEVAVTVSVWFSLAAPELIPERFTVCKPAFSLMVRLASELRVGGWLTGLTVTVKD